jgi:FHS family glucose/mannose:H+ symporter-like MFS transporter
MAAIPLPLLIIAGFCAFLIIGIEQGVLGIFVAELGQLYERDPEELGLFFALHGVGSALVTGAALIPFIEERNHRRITIAALCMATGAWLVSGPAAWPLKLVASVLLGIGFGGLSMAFNTLFVTRFSQHNASLLNVLNATYGLGAVAGPWILTRQWLDGQGIFTLIAIASALLAVLSITIDDRVPARDQVTIEGARTGSIAPILSVAFLTLMIEAGLTYWVPSLLDAQGYGADVIANFMTTFFAWFVVIRLLAALTAAVFNTFIFAVFGHTGVVITLTLAATGQLSLADIGFIGAFMGIIFPNAYAWMLNTSRGGTTTGAKIMLSAISGATAGPYVLGWVLPLFGTTAVLVTLLTAGLVTIGLMSITQLRALAK